MSPKTIARWAREGRLPSVRTLGGHRRFPRADIERLAAMDNPTVQRPVK